MVRLLSYLLNIVLPVAVQLLASTAALAWDLPETLPHVKNAIVGVGTVERTRRPLRCFVVLDLWLVMATTY